MPHTPKPMGNLPDRPKRTFNSSIRDGSSLREFTGRARRALHFQMGGALALAAQPGAGFTSELPEICEYRAKLDGVDAAARSIFSPTAKRCSCHFENASLSGRFIASCIGIFARSIKPCLRSSHHFLGFDLGDFAEFRPRPNRLARLPKGRRPLFLIGPDSRLARPTSHNRSRTQLRVW